MAALFAAKVFFLSVLIALPFNRGLRPIEPENALWQTGQGLFQLLPGAARNEPELR